MSDTIRPEVSVALQAMRALTPEERGRVLCWFCPRCFAYEGPGQSCECGRPEATPTKSTCGVVNACEAYASCANEDPVVRWALTFASYVSRGGAGWCESYLPGLRLTEKRRRGALCVTYDTGLDGVP